MTKTKGKGRYLWIPLLLAVVVIMYVGVFVFLWQVRTAVENARERGILLDLLNSYSELVGEYEELTGNDIDRSAAEMYRLLDMIDRIEMIITELNNQETVRNTDFLNEPITVEVTREVTVLEKLTDFSCIEELEAFLKEDDTNERLFLRADNTGVAKLTGVCEERAFQLRDRAIAEGKRLETEILSYVECVRYSYDMSNVDGNDGHYINKAVIGNGVYYIEPSTDRIWLAYYLD